MKAPGATCQRRETGSGGFPGLLTTIQGARSTASVYFPGTDSELAVSGPQRRRGDPPQPNRPPTQTKQIRLEVLAEVEAETQSELARFQARERELKKVLRLKYSKRRCTRDRNTNLRRADVELLLLWQNEMADLAREEVLTEATRSFPWII